MYDLVVLGGGPGGLSVATAAAAVGARVALVEKHRLGGECTFSACVPSKALIRAATLAHRARNLDEFGIRAGRVEVDFPAVMERVRSVVQGFATSDAKHKLRARGIEVYLGSPAFEAYDSVVVEGLDGQTRLTGRRFVIATGSRPAVPVVPGLVESGYLDNDSIWNLTERPESLLIVGAGPVGIEFGQAFARLGTRVTILADSDRILPREDPEVSHFLQSILAADGITIHLNASLAGVSLSEGRKLCTFQVHGGGTAGVASTHILLATGRLANVEGLNLEAVGIDADPQNGIEVDGYLQTHARNIYALGDVLGRWQFTHAAEREAAVVFRNAVLGLPKTMDYAALPWATFTDPEVATVGSLEPPGSGEAAPGTRLFRAELAELDRARIDGQTLGFAKLLVTDRGKILGATVVGHEASAVLQEFVLAMEHGLTLTDIRNTVHTYPTYNGLALKLANRFSATRLEKGIVQTVLRWFYGFAPRGAARRADSDNEAKTENEAEPEPIPHAPAHAEAHTHVHGH